jgi:hypothetical protein
VTLKSRRCLGVLWTTLGAAGLLAAPYTHAESPRGAYGGGGLGWASITVAEDDGDYYYFPTYDEGEEETALALHFGYRLTKYLATEFGYIDTAPQWEETFVYLPELNDVYNNFVDLDIQTGQLSVIGVLPFARVWEVYLKGGIAFWQGDADQLLIRTSDSAVTRRTVTDSSTDFLFGFGIGASPKPAWHLRFEFQSFGIDRDLVNAQGTTTIDSMLFGVQFHPGAKAEASPASAALTDRFQRRIGAL